MARIPVKTAFVSFVLVLLAASNGFTAPRTWSEQEATAEVERDISPHKIKFYWHGGFASMPVGVPPQHYKLVGRYPHADGGIGCIVDDSALRGRQRRYSEIYNKRMLNYLLKRR